MAGKTDTTQPLQAYGWAIPEEASQDSGNLIGQQPPPYTVNPSVNSQQPSLSEKQQPLLAGGHTPPYPSNFSNNPSPGWSTGPGQNLDSRSANYGDASVNPETTFSIENEEDKAGPFSEKKIRMGFIRKVYAILMLQLTITTGFIAVFLFEENLARFSRENPEMLFISGGFTIIIVIGMACCNDIRRTWPINIILLVIFTLFESWTLGTLCSFYEVESVLIAAGMCTVVCLALTIFAFQTKYDFTVCGSALYVSLLILMLLGFCAMIIPGNTVQIAYSALGALLFSFYLIYDTQMIIGGDHKYAVSPEEYIFAALSIYLDIIQLFIRLLVIFGKKK